MSTDASRSLDNTNIADAKASTPDIKVFGNGDMWKLLNKASSASQGWMKSTKVMQVGDIGCLVQVTTEHRDVSSMGSIFPVTAAAEALTFVPGAKLEDFDFPTDGDE